MLFAKITIRRVLMALLFGFFMGSCIEFGETLHVQGVDSVPTVVSSWLNLPSRLLEWPVNIIYVRLFGPVEYPKHVWLGRSGIEWVGFVMNLVLYGFVFYWCH